MWCGTRSRVSRRALRDQAVEIIVALKKLGEALTPEELHILETSDEAMKQFEIADKAIGVGLACWAVMLRVPAPPYLQFTAVHSYCIVALCAGDSVLSIAGSSIKSATASGRK